LMEECLQVEKNAYRIAVHQCSSNRAAIDPSRAGLCFVGPRQQARFRCDGCLLLLGLVRHI
jgi:hypothetical protein